MVRIVQDVSTPLSVSFNYLIFFSDKNKKVFLMNWKNWLGEISSTPVPAVIDQRF